MGSEPAQNLVLCVALMTLSGLLRVIATMVLAYRDYGNNQLEQETRRHYIVLHVLFLALGAFFSVVGTFYGPVSLAIPVQTGAQILFNVVAMGPILRMKKFNSSQRVATCIVFLSVISLIDVGPRPQNGQDMVRLLCKPWAALWCLMVTGCLVHATVTTMNMLKQAQIEAMITGDEHVSTLASIEHQRLTSESESSRFGPEHAWKAVDTNFVVLLSGVTLSNVALATSGKILEYFDGTRQLCVFLYYCLAAFAGIMFSVTSATACDQALFTPASSVALIIVNLLSGLVIWEDWKVLHTPLGYGCAVALMCCGVFLLADMDSRQHRQFPSNDTEDEIVRTKSDSSHGPLKKQICTSANSRTDEESLQLHTPVDKTSLSIVAREV